MISERGGFEVKVLLVYPESPDPYWSFKYAHAFESKRSAFPPLGLLTDSAMLPENWETLAMTGYHLRKLTEDYCR